MLQPRIVLVVFRIDDDFGHDDRNSFVAAGLEELEDVTAIDAVPNARLVDDEAFRGRLDALEPHRKLTDNARRNGLVHEAANYTQGGIIGIARAEVANDGLACGEILADECTLRLRREAADAQRSFEADGNPHVGTPALQRARRQTRSTVGRIQTGTFLAEQDGIQDDDVLALGDAGDDPAEVSDILLVQGIADDFQELDG